MDQGCSEHRGCGNHRSVSSSSSREECGSDIPSDWSRVQLFTVGSSSVEYLSSAQSTLHSNMRLNVEGVIQAKSATELLPCLTTHNGLGPYLIIRGDKSTNELQSGLTAAGKVHREMTVYTTSARPKLATDVEFTLDLLERENSGASWLVFFSPSSAELVLPLIRHEVERHLVAAIGSTTERYLLQQGVGVNAVAEEPTAEGLLRAIQVYEQKPKGGVV